MNRFWGGFEKRAVSVKWVLDKLRGGVASRANLVPGTKRYANVMGILKPRLADKSLRAHPHDNLKIIKKLNGSIKKHKNKLGVDEALNFMESL